MTQDFSKFYYDEFPRIEEEFQNALDGSLDPRGPDLLYELAGTLGLSAESTVLDLGCGEGEHSIRLAETFGCNVIGVDPVPRHIELATGRRGEAAPELGETLRFEEGTAEAVPLKDASVDLIWCREVLYHIPSLDRALVECRRVLRGGGHMLIYHNFATDRLQPNEVGWDPTNVAMRPSDVENASLAAGFEIRQRIELGSEFGEYAEESKGGPARRLIHTARLMRDPERYIAKYGQKNYDIMLGDCLWHVYRMIGKLSSFVYVLWAAS